MKPFFFVLFALLAVISTATAEEKVISGYGIGEFAVKGVIAERVETLVAMIKSARPDSTYAVSITVTGSADSRGISAQNDRLSKDRAEAITAMLASEFPKAKINIVPKGDEENSRQVAVKYEFTKPVPDNSLTEIKTKLDSLSTERIKDDKKAADDRKKALIWFMIGVLAIFAIIFLFGWYFLRKKPAVPAEIVSVPEEVPWNEVELIWLDIVTRDGGTYSVEVGYKWRIVGGKEEKVFVSPFTNLGERKEKIQKFSKPDIISSLRGCLEGGKFAAQTLSLKDSKKIIKKS